MREASNAIRTAQFVVNEPALAGKVHIPVVYPEYSTKRVMVAEWIEGVRLSDKAGIYRLMGERQPAFSPSDPMSASALVASSSLEVEPSKYRFPDKPLKGGVKAIMQTMVELFSAQMFSWGWVHCDPHPGNIIVRPSPNDPSRPQLVLIDHGLYAKVPELFMKQWVQLWRAMLVGDFAGVESVTKQWGFGLPDLMASFTLMKPTFLQRGREVKVRKEGDAAAAPRRPLTQYEMSVLMKQKLKEFLVDTDRMPKVLIFLTRNMRMVQGNNQSFGSPVNRIKITGEWASKSLFRRTDLPLRERATEWWRHVAFRLVMFTLDLAFWRNRLVTWALEWRDWVLMRKARKPRGGFEEELEEQMRSIAKDSLGVDPGPNVFAG